MTSIAAAREPFEPTAASPTTGGEPVTGRTRTAWSAGRGDQSQPETFRALAWSQCEDCLAEPLPYTGEEYSAPEMDSRPMGRMADVPERAGTPRLSRPGLLSVVAAGFAAAVAAAGAMFAVVNSDGVPTTNSPVVIRPAQNSSLPQPRGGNGGQGEALRPAPAAPTPAKTAGSPARAVPPAADNPPTRLNTPLPTVGVAQPAAPPPLATEMMAPKDPPPDVAAPEAAPPADAPSPVLTPPVVSLPGIPVLEEPHAMGPNVIHAPAISGDPAAPIPDLAGSAPPVIQDPATPAAVDRGIALNPGLTDPIIPTFTVGSG